ncbi:hypothetical protein CWI37_0898p0010 [Hamiltosporidium tvaerminnensis]|uniref:Uncharacterized protein n=1 Tax=Hamiltosporidium tvaerminnensis TaxID=1176355 RepID=A0A4Q9L0E7_9MICR|nr:hypothetical protein CWI37_0898p0010 [Hamiltosporidium tvaerminnensis]
MQNEFITENCCKNVKKNLYKLPKKSDPKLYVKIPLNINDIEKNTNGILSMRSNTLRTFTETIKKSNDINPAIKFLLNLFYYEIDSYDENYSAYIYFSLKHNLPRIDDSTKEIGFTIISSEFIYNIESFIRFNEHLNKNGVLKKKSNEIIHNIFSENIKKDGLVKIERNDSTNNRNYEVIFTKNIFKYWGIRELNENLSFIGHFCFYSVIEEFCMRNIKLQQKETEPFDNFVKFLKIIISNVFDKLFLETDDFNEILLISKTPFILNKYTLKNINLGLKFEITPFILEIQGLKDDFNKKYLLNQKNPKQMQNNKKSFILLKDTLNTFEMYSKTEKNNLLFIWYAIYSLLNEKYHKNELWMSSLIMASILISHKNIKEIKLENIEDIKINSEEIFKILRTNEIYFISEYNNFVKELENNFQNKLNTLYSIILENAARGPKIADVNRICKNLVILNSENTMIFHKFCEENIDTKIFLYLENIPYYLTYYYFVNKEIFIEMTTDFEIYLQNIKECEKSIRPFLDGHYQIKDKKMLFDKNFKYKKHCILTLILMIILIASFCYYIYNKRAHKKSFSIEIRK